MNQQLKNIFRRFYLLCLLLLIAESCFAQISMCTWNMKDMGKSKDETEINFIAQTVREFDVIAVQEVVAGSGGAQAIARLHDALNRTGSKWDYTISNPTSGTTHQSERYAFLWKTAKLKKLGDAWLEQKYELEICREPYLCTFQYGTQQFTIVSMHAITASKNPETEIKYLKLLPEQYPKLNLIFCGDYNCPQSNSVFTPLKKSGYKPALFGQKTSLKTKYGKDGSLASEFDNIFFNTKKVHALASGCVHFYEKFQSLEAARLVSDHLPVYLKFEIP
jgi:endonuclease/exonuclease/phosphatase family metal-dependent hydrolase